MCGRYEVSIFQDLKGKEIKKRAKELNLIYSEGEIFPTNNVLCYMLKGSKIDLASMKWGIKTNNLQINARLESLNDKAMYKNLKKNRCAVIATGFYEWDKYSHKYYIHTKDKYIYFACVFNETNELLIITKEATNDFSRIHNRMPVIMNEKEMINYLNSNEIIIDEKELIIKNISEQTSLF